MTASLTVALLSKFSTIYLLPIVLVFVVVFAWLKNRRQLLHLVYLLTGVAAGISVFYGLISFKSEGWAGFWPSEYLTGVGIVFAQVSFSHRFSYLLGESYYGSRWYYFPILIAVKTQLLTLVGLGLGLIFLVKNRLHLSRGRLIILVAPPLIFLGTAIFSKFNIGIRHILPIYPFLIILASAGIVFSIKYLSKNFRNQILVLGILFLLVLTSRAWSVAATYPHFLSYYNFFGGGTDNGWKVADDSNYDWGQDVRRLADYVKENHIASVAFDNYSGTYAADYYHMPFTLMGPEKTATKGYVALSTSVITFYEDKEKSYSWIIDNYQPIARAGKSIFIFYLR